MESKKCNKLKSYATIALLLKVIIDLYFGVIRIIHNDGGFSRVSSFVLILIQCFAIALIALALLGRLPNVSVNPVTPIFSFSLLIVAFIPLLLFLINGSPSAMLQFLACLSVYLMVFKAKKSKVFFLSSLLLYACVLIVDLYLRKDILFVGGLSINQIINTILTIISDIAMVLFSLWYGFEKDLIKCKPEVKSLVITVVVFAVIFFAFSAFRGVIIDVKNSDNSIDIFSYETVKCKSCGKEFEKGSENGKSIKSSGFCINCKDNFEWGMKAKEAEKKYKEENNLD